MSLLNELEDIHTYLEQEDTFFFTMVYDPNQKTLLVDKGEIRVGTDYQAEIPPYVDPGLWCGASVCVCMYVYVHMYVQYFTRLEAGY